MHRPDHLIGCGAMKILSIPLIPSAIAALVYAVFLSIKYDVMFDVALFPFIAAISSTLLIRVNSKGGDQ